MKKKILLAFTASCFILAITSCDKLKEAIFQAFTADGATFNFSIPPVNTTDGAVV